jgi:maltose alpha-D-glucosyltransferase/alpha-amylase
MRINLGIRRRLAPLLDNDRRLIEVANSLLFSLSGTPIIYYGDEIGMGDNIELFDRNGVRTPMQWQPGLNAGFSNAPAETLYAPVISAEPYDPGRVNVEAQTDDPGSLWHTLQRMIAVRKQHPSFGLGDFQWADSDSLALAAYWRRYADERLLIVNNLSGQPLRASINLPGSDNWRLTSLLPASEYPKINPGCLELDLKPYEYLWLKLNPQ